MIAQLKTTPFFETELNKIAVVRTIKNQSVADFRACSGQRNLTLLAEGISEHIIQLAESASIADKFGSGNLLLLFLLVGIARAQEPHLKIAQVMIAKFGGKYIAYRILWQAELSP